MTVIPVAVVRGGGGGGSGEGPPGEGGSGSGGGFGLSARAAGAYVVRNGEVTWSPALDLNRVILGAQVVGIVAILALGSALKARARRRERS